MNEIILMNLLNLFKSNLFLQGNIISTVRYNELSSPKVKIII